MTRHHALFAYFLVVAFFGFAVGWASLGIQKIPITDYEAAYDSAFVEFEESAKTLSDLEKIERAGQVYEGERAADANRSSAVEKRNKKWTALSLISVLLCSVLGAYAGVRFQSFAVCVFSAVSYYAAGAVLFIADSSSLPASTGISTGTIPVINGAFVILVTFVLARAFCRSKGQSPS